MGGEIGRLRTDGRPSNMQVAFRIRILLVLLLTITSARYGTRVDYIFCNESFRSDWMPVQVEHHENCKEEFGDHSAVIATLIKKSGK